MINFKHLIIIFFNTLSMLFISSVNAASQEQLNRLKETAEQFVRSQIAVPENGKLSIYGVNLDPRLRISDCKKGLQQSIPNQQGFEHRVTVLIKCPSENWQIYVPVAIRLLIPTLVAKRALARGSVIKEADVGIQLTNSRLHRGQIYTEINQLVGSKVKRRIGIHSPITTNDVCIVCKNDNVMILSQNEHIQIETKGAALNDGTLGEQIKVRNIRSNKVIAATISAVGKVKVN